MAVYSLFIVALNLGQVLVLWSRSRGVSEGGGGGGLA